MSDIVRDPGVIAGEINFIKRQTAATCLNSAIEIGKLLVEAKAALEHGEWGKWLEENVDYSTSTANNLMKLYNCYGNKKELETFVENASDIFGALSPSQALVLTALPEQKRAEYVQTHDVENESVKEMKKQISDLLNKEKEKDVLLQKLNSDIASYKEKDIKNTKKISDLKDKIDSVSDTSRDFEKKYEAANEKVLVAEKQIKELSKKASADESNMRKEYEDELNRYKERLQRAESSDLQRFSVYFELLQSNFNMCKGLLQKFDTETASKLKESLLKISHIFAEQVTD